MLGHQLWRELSPRNEVWATVRRSFPPGIPFPSHQRDRMIVGIDAAVPGAVEKLVTELRPQVVLNCVGIVKQLPDAARAIPALTINSLLPHRLAEVCSACSSRLVLFSTDCVFSGRRGAYTELDEPDPIDLYGRSKLLGEIADQPHVLTLRTSIIGRELEGAHGLLDWFLSAPTQIVHGYRRAIFSGLTTIELSRVVDRVLSHEPAMTGLWHVAGDPIDKCSLLTLVKKAFGVATEIQPDDAIQCNRSLRADRFNSALGYAPPAWANMIAEVAATSAGR